MRKTLFVLLGCATLFTYWACNKNSNAVGPANSLPSSSNDYFPLAVGDQWTYHIWSDSDGVKTPGSDATGPEGIVNDTTIGGRLAYGIGVPGYGSAFSYFALDAQGNLLQFSNIGIGQTGGEWVHYTDFSNTVVGHTENLLISGGSFVDTMGGLHDTIRVADTMTETYMGEVTVTVPAGTFNAVYYKDSLGTVGFYGLIEKYYAKDIGLIKQVSLDISGGIFSSPITTQGQYEELVSYSLK
ncbi:MAG TPA: hypothetical protein VFA55_09655 [Candidatus Kapabacteria bacterium]|nr:hypothetical protein [Candidatus Kapabacteria bacterium]